MYMHFKNKGFSIDRTVALIFLLSVTPLDIWVSNLSSCSFHKPCGKAYGDYKVIRAAAHSCSLSINISITELSWAVAYLAHLPAMRLLSIQCTGVQPGNSRSPETNWKAFLLKINPVRPRPAFQPWRPCAACRLAGPSPLIHWSVSLMQKPSYGCARAGAGAFKPPTTHAVSHRHMQTQIQTQRKHFYKEQRVSPAWHVALQASVAPAEEQVLTV